MAFWNIKVSDDYSKSERLDKYISTVNPDMNRSKLKAGLTELLVNGKKQKVSYKVKAGDLIYLQWEDNIPDDIEPENIPLDIIYEDDDVCVVNKKQGMVTHPACGNWSGTLVNALLYHWGRDSVHQLKTGTESEIALRRRPGIVHRLDKDTSGIIITAKNRDSLQWLSDQFKNHSSITKEYICICFGRPHHKKGKIVTHLVRDSRDRHKFKAVTDTTDGKVAVSYYKCIACYGEYSLMRVRILTGRTHQIRVHMKYLNCPILGDSLYYKTDKKFPNATLMLHSRLLRIKLPGKNVHSEFKTPVPKRFSNVLKILRRDFPKTILSDSR